jgi:hypothetical protein
MGVSVYVKGAYGKISGFGQRKNKAKQSQFINVQCSAFSGLRQDEQKGFEKT